MYTLNQYFTEEKMNSILVKLLSGRYVFTVVVALCFAYLSCQQIIDKEQSMQVILIVLYAYFTKQRPSA